MRSFRSSIDHLQFSQQKILPLHEIKVTALPDSPGKIRSSPSFIIEVIVQENTFAWLISSPKKSFVVRANSDRERQEWIAHLERCIRTASGEFVRRSRVVHSSVRNSEGNRNQINAVAAHWIPDDRADICMHCRQAKFSAVYRRHVR